MANPRNKALLTGAVTVALVAVVLIALGLLGPLFGSHKSTPQNFVTSTSPSDASNALYEQALAAQRSGDLTRTAELARQAIAADPTNTAAQQLLSSVSSGSSSSSGGSGSSGGSSGGSAGTTSTVATTAPSVNPVYLTKISDLTSLMPTAFPGYDMAQALQISRDVSVSGQPSRSGGAVLNITWSVHDRTTTKTAKSFITKTSKSAYSHNPSSVAVDGTTGYFGTDGTKFATIAFTRGRYVFEIIVTATGNSPSGTKADALKAANAFPALPAK